MQFAYSPTDPDSSYYHFLHHFCDCLKELELKKIPNTSYIYGSQPGRVQDLYNYIRHFEKLENLEIDQGIMWHIFGCGLLVKYSSATLVKLAVNLGIEEGDEDDVSVSTTSQRKDAQSSDICPNLKILVIREYIPRNIFEEFMYIKKKICEFGKTGDDSR